MNTGSGNGIQIPENLFKAIDRVHKESTAIFNGLDTRALELISPNRKTNSSNSNNSSASSVKPK